MMRYFLICGCVLALALPVLSQERAAVRGAGERTRGVPQVFDLSTAEATRYRTTIDRVTIIRGELSALKQKIDACSAAGGFFAPGSPLADANDCFKPPVCGASNKLIFTGAGYTCVADKIWN